MSEKSVEPQETQEKQVVKIQIKVDNVDLEGMEEYLGIMRMDNEFTYEEFLKKMMYYEISKYIFDEEDFQEQWEKYPAFTAMECLKRFKDNQQKLMVAFKHLGPEEVFKSMGGELVHEESIEKTQERTRFKNADMQKLANRFSEEKINPEDIEKYEHTYKDIYKLFKISRETFAKNGVENMDDAYVVEAVCPSTDHHFFLFVDGEEEACRTAIGAVAWTLVKPDGNHMTRDEYIYMKKEA